MAKPKVGTFSLLKMVLELGVDVEQLRTIFTACAVLRNVRAENILIAKGHKT